MTFSDRVIAWLLALSIMVFTLRLVTDGLTEFNAALSRPFVTADGGR